MRRLATADRIRAFLEVLGRSARQPAKTYLTGGATAVLEGWRESTVDVDVLFVPDDELLRAVPQLKEELELNVEVAAPLHFIPVAPGWEDRSPFVVQEGTVSVHHFDLVAQALSKVERGHAKDLDDVHAMLGRRLITPAAVRDAFDAIEAELYRYPAIDPPSFRRAVEDLLRNEAHAD